MLKNSERSQNAICEARRLIETSRARIERTARLIEEQLQQHARLDTYCNVLRASAGLQRELRRAS